uniref:Serine aminopeptidase S33 domain-containing protein n=1 Tax=Pinguiococcus pyrenoidosus TaxID=172671 RepID=A0A7R9YE29_9STRA|mmetsp:Transcript_6080/g.23645  ORF Transcript_6080/g.23645 Transcript_6080/m.23645 type:complete len:341 (+) Transcript_6080:174-1196(+)
MGCALSSIVFQPPSFPSTIPKSDVIELQTKHNSKIAGLHVELNSEITVVVSHGNAEDLGMISKWAMDFARQLQVNVLCYDYDGYGHSEGTPTEIGCYNDIDAVLEYLTAPPPLGKGVDVQSIVFFGRSLGSGPTCYMAQKLSLAGTPPAGVVLQAPLLSALRVALDLRYTFQCDMFPNVHRVRDFRTPTLIIHGTHDEIVPFWHGERLFFTLPPQYRARPLWVHGAGHNNIEAVLRQDGAFYDGLKDFLDEHCRRQWKQNVENAFQVRQVRQGVRGKGKGGEHASRKKGSMDMMKRTPTRGTGASVANAATKARHGGANASFARGAIVKSRTSGTQRLKT